MADCRRIAISRSLIGPPLHGILSISALIIHTKGGRLVSSIIFRAALYVSDKPYSLTDLFQTQETNAVMSSEVQRKLTTILAADAAGYSRAMDVDEVRTLGALHAARSIFSKFIERHHGRIANTAGAKRPTPARSSASERQAEPYEDRSRR